MRIKKKKAVVRAIFLYLLLTTGVWMFLTAYVNSRNRYKSEQTSPASFTFSESEAQIRILEHTLTIETVQFQSESRLYYTSYMLAADEAKIAAVLMSLTDEL